MCPWDCLRNAAGIAEEIGFTGFLQHHWQDRYHPMKLTLYVALLWALWHLPDHFAKEGWGLEQLIAAPVVFAIGFVTLFFARVLLVFLYNRTGYSVLLVAIFHASFDASISQLSDDVVPASNTARFLIFTGMIVALATAVIIATKGRLGGFGWPLKHFKAATTGNLLYDRYDFLGKDAGRAGSRRGDLGSRSSAEPLAGSDAKLKAVLRMLARLRDPTTGHLLHNGPEHCDDPRAVSSEGPSCPHVPGFLHVR